MNTNQVIPLHVEFSILDMFEYLEDLAKAASSGSKATAAAIQAAAAAADAAANGVPQETFSLTGV